MRARAVLDAVSKRAPVIVVLAYCAALVGAWSDAPNWLSNGLAIVVAGLALMVLASRRRRDLLSSADDSASTRSGDWLAHELAGKGSPPGFYLLGFFGIVAIFLTGFEKPWSKLAWAGLFLGIVWGVVNARYPAEEGSEG